MKHLLQPLAAFRPPSDMTSTDGGGKKKLWVGLGIGCGVILLVVGILFAAGAFQAVSCCNTVKEVAESSVGAQKFGQEFADAVAAQKVDDAYAMTSADFRSQTTKDAFANVLAANAEKMKANAPRMFDIQMDTNNDPTLEGIKSGHWRVSYQFAGPSDQTMLLLLFVVRKNEDGGFVADAVSFDERARDISREPPAIEVLQFHNQLQGGNYEMAYSRLAPGFQGETDFESFRAFLGDAGEALTASDLSIREVAYNADNSQASVVAQSTTTATKKNALIQYELVPMQPDMPGFGWRIVTIAPLVAEATDGQNQAPDDSAGTNQDPAGDEGGTNGAPAAVEPPTVEVDDTN